MSSTGINPSEFETGELELQRVNRALRVISHANKVLASTADFVAWMNQICQSAVNVGHYQLAWVGLAEQDEQITVRPVAYAGFEAGHFASGAIKWKDEPHGRSPVGIAIRTGLLSIARDIPGDAAFAPWRKESAQLGYRSVIALPLIDKDRTFGVLVIYDGDIDAFGPREIEILNELASDLASGVILISPAIIERRSATEALKESLRKLGQIERISHLAQWDRDLDTDIVTWSDELYRILGLEPQQKKYHFLEFAELIHPDDRAAVVKLAADIKHRMGGFHVDYRVIRPDGELRFLHGEGEVVRDEMGQPRRSVGFLQDITEQQVAKSAMENANRSLEMKNIALEEVLKNIEAERNKIGHRVTRNVEHMCLPLLQSIKQGTTHQQRRAIEQVENCLRDIISPFIDQVADAVKTLTPTELRVCTYIKRGLAVKQIADLEHLSPETISAHRRNIRRKLQIANRKINLTTYLRDVFSDPPSIAR
jgi:PAS domain S-box-containing protein